MVAIRQSNERIQNGVDSTTIKVYVDTRRKLKLLAALLGKNMQDTAAEAIDKALEEAQRKADTKQI